MSDALPVIKLPRETMEALEVAILADSDPTGDVVEFAFAVLGDRPSTWTAGTWDGAYAGGRATAVTPTIGLAAQAPDVEIEIGSDWVVFVRVTDNPEVPVRECGVVRLT